MLDHANAKFPVTRSGGESCVNVPKGTQGFVLWGPYQTLEPGDYDITFEITPTEYGSLDEACCAIDIATQVGKQILVRRDVAVADVLARGGKLTETFRMKETAPVEFRVSARGGAGFRVRYFRKAYPVASRGQPMVLERNPVYVENFGVINGLEKGGIKFALEGDELVAAADGMRLEVQSAEDLQLLGEVFLNHDYTVLPPRACIAIDVGMNVGYASLALAKNPRIETVFAYEPFAAPFRRAAWNFRRNPEPAAKIRPVNVGLADRTEDLEVISDPISTIGTSIRGRSSGSPERIRIRDAAEELGPRIEEAVGRDLGVVMKVDCEGSEFAIFESLKRASLFDAIDAIMIEWHKWWSVEKTQADLIAPLRDAGYFVFDRTHPANPHAGFLQAVRAARGKKPGR